MANLTSSQSGDSSLSGQVEQMYLLYNAITMISDLETNLFMFFHKDHMCIEIACHVQGIVEDRCYIYLDFKSLLPIIASESIVTEDMKGHRKSAIVVAHLLRGLFLTPHPSDPFRLFFSIKPGLIIEGNNAVKYEDHNRQPRRPSLVIITAVMQRPDTLEPFDFESKRYRIPVDDEVDTMWSNVVVAWQISLANAHSLNNNASNPNPVDEQTGAGGGRSTLLEKKWLAGDGETGGSARYSLPEINTAAHSQFHTLLHTPSAAPHSPVSDIPHLPSISGKGGPAENGGVKHVYDFIISRSSFSGQLPVEASKPSTAENVPEQPTPAANTNTASTATNNNQQRTRRRSLGGLAPVANPNPVMSRASMLVVSSAVTPNPSRHNRRPTSFSGASATSNKQISDALLHVHKQFTQEKVE